uniref:HTH_48 domain-containing protein n=1 Tax=Meloidogyne hapla TaxID=6305 RepID=A0A1I8B7A0_MELHA
MPKTQIRALIHHEYTLGRKPMETLKNIAQSKGPDAISRRAIYWWYAKFRNGQENVEYQLRSGRPSTNDQDAVLKAIEADPTLSTRMLAEGILRKHGKKVRKGRWVPHELSIQQKNKSLLAAQQLLQRYQKEKFLSRIVTCDENPDCGPCDYHLFASLATLLPVIDHIQNHLRLYFASKTPEFYSRGIDLFARKMATHY